MPNKKGKWPGGTVAKGLPAFNQANVEHVERGNGMLMTDGVRLIAAERSRQVEVGWTAAHDAMHADGQLIEAALAYLRYEVFGVDGDADWPFDDTRFKPSMTDHVRNLVKAGALIAAEIDRLRGTIPGDLP